MKYEALNQKILEMQEEIIGAVQESIRIDSIKGEAEPDAPIIFPKIPTIFPRCV